MKEIIFEIDMCFPLSSIPAEYIFPEIYIETQHEENKMLYDNNIFHHTIPCTILINSIIGDVKGIYVHNSANVPVGCSITAIPAYIDIIKIIVINAIYD